MDKYLFEYSSDGRTLLKCERKTTGNITVPAGIISIGYGAFASCLYLTSVDLPNTLREIGRYAFSRCINLESLDVPQGVLRIGVGAFYGCNNLKQILIPSSVNTIDKYAFSGCTNLNEVHLRHNILVDFSESFEGIDLSSISLFVKSTIAKEVNQHQFYSQFKKILIEK